MSVMLCHLWDHMLVTQCYFPLHFFPLYSGTGILKITFSRLPFSKFPIWILSMRGTYIRFGSRGEVKTLFQWESNGFCEVLCPENDPFHCYQQLSSSALSPCNSYTSSAFQFTSLISRFKSLLKCSKYLNWFLLFWFPAEHPTSSIQAGRSMSVC